MNIKEFLESKKAKGFILGLLGLGLAHYGGFSQEEQKNILYLAGLYLGSQGVADMGKEKAKVEAAAAAPQPGASGAPGDV